MSQHTITVSGAIPHPRTEIWKLLNDFPSVYLYNPGVKRSYTIDQTPAEGVGARRRCDLYQMGQWVKEQVIEQEENIKQTISVYEGTLPMKNVIATITLSDVESGTRVTFTMEFDNKIPLVGNLMAKLMLKPMMTKSMNEFIAGINSYLTTGIEVTNKTEL